MAMSEDMKLLLVIKARSDAAAAFDSVSKKLDQLIAKGADVGSSVSGIGGAIGKGMTFFFADKTLKDLRRAADAVLEYRKELDGANVSFAEAFGAAARELPVLDDMVRMWDSLINVTFRYNQVREIELNNAESSARNMVNRIAAARDEARELRGLTEYGAKLHTIEKQRAADLAAIAQAGRAGRLGINETDLANRSVEADAADRRRLLALDELRKQAEANQKESDAVLEKQRAAERKRHDEHLAAIVRAEKEAERARLDGMRATGDELGAVLEGIRAKYRELDAQTTSAFERNLLADARAADELRAKLDDAKRELGNIEKSADKVKINTLTGGVSADAVSGRFSGLAARFIGTDQAQLAEARETKAAVKRQEAVISRIEELLRQTLRGLAPIGIGA